jgi:acetyl-CoA synthetase
MQQGRALGSAPAMPGRAPRGAGLNIAYVAVDRHAAGPAADRVALRFLAESGAVRDLTYAELARRSSKFAAVLRSLGITKGDRVFVLTGRIPELYVAVLGGLKAGAVVCTLFAAFGPEPIAQRLRIGGGRVLVTTPEMYDRKVADGRGGLPDLARVLLTGDPASGSRPGTDSFDALIDVAEPDFAIEPTAADDAALLHFTSGTTGKPKGAVHVHGAFAGHRQTARLVLDLQPDDLYWCTADPGWVTGISYGVVAPLVIGATSIVDEAEFDVHRWYRILDQQRVTVWYTAPTAIRRLMRAGEETAAAYDLSALRVVASVGEPLNAEAVLWGRRVLHRTIKDSWWQTETGGIVIANYGDTPVRPGSMGPAGAGHDRGRTRPGRGRSGPPGRWSRGGGDAAEHGGGVGPANTVALDVPRLPERSGAVRRLFRRRLVPHRRPGPDRRGRVLLVRRPGRRRDQDCRSSDRSVRGGERPAGAPGGRRGRSHRPAGPAGR